MSEPLDDRIRRVIRVIGEASPEPPSLLSHQLSSGRDDAASGRWGWVAVAAVTFIVVGGIVGVATLLLRGLGNQLPPPVAPLTTEPAGTSAIPVLHELFEYTQSAELTCEGGELTESGEFDSMTIEVWADFESRRFRQQVTYPDGSTRDVIALGHPSLPRESYARGEARGRRVECSTAGLLLFDPTDTIGVLLFNSPIEEPGAMGYAELGTLAAGEHTDSRGRPADLYQEVTEGFSGDGSGTDQPISQVTEWYVDPTGDGLLEVTFSQTSDGIVTFSQTTTLITQDEVSVEASLFDTEGYTLTWDESDYSEGAGVEGRPIEPFTRLGPEWIWPEIPDPAGPTEVASRFATEVLGWEAATVVADPQAAPDGPTFVTINDGAGRSVTFLTFPTVDGWAANQIGEGRGAGVGAEATLKVFIAPPGGATSAIVLVGTADTTLAWQAELTPDMTEITLPGITFDDLHTVLILYSDGSGQVIDASGGSFVP